MVAENGGASMLKVADSFQGSVCLVRAEVDPEATAFSRLGIDTAGAAHAFDGPGHYGEADARAGVFIGGAGALEDAKDFWLNGLIHSDAIIFDPQSNGIAARL